MNKHSNNDCHGALLLAMTIRTKTQTTIATAFTAFTHRNDETPTKTSPDCS
ncbi:hypothetical protein [uncultured Fibrobacter sp.]|uniref:hypothetical protein n=1 Tax=uncultured Fibrobacter sp. TaxID=261512 RepID=UPI002804C348|nr:hypothetical protein [uncultured Fibrobacter sp.]